MKPDDINLNKQGISKIFSDIFGRVERVHITIFSTYPDENWGAFELKTSGFFERRTTNEVCLVGNARGHGRFVDEFIKKVAKLRYPDIAETIETGFKFGACENIKIEWHYSHPLGPATMGCNFVVGDTTFNLQTPATRLYFAEISSFIESFMQRLARQGE